MTAVRDSDRGFAALLKRMRRAASPTELTVGVHEAEGSAEHGDGATILDIAVVHEFGLGNVPRRSFIGDWQDETEQEHAAAIRAVAKAVVAGDVESVEQGAERLGLRFVGEVQRRIAEGIDPPLDPATVARKGSSTPLIDTGQLRTSITYRVRRR